MKTYNKLVRDKIPQILDAKGITYESRIADDQEYKTELIKKLFEEVAEFQEKYDPEELADILEVIKALEKIHEYADLEVIREKKKQEKGGFEKRIILKGSC